jgi:iron complex transport system substrate-binding protein
MEGHPLARAEYLRLFGFLTGREEFADSLFDSIAAGYNNLANRVSNSGEKIRKVLMNIPYQDQWFVPGGNNYMSILVKDAGGSILGSVPGSMESSTISLEEAYRLSEKADCWLNVGWCRSLSDLAGIKTLFGAFPLKKMEIYNNILRTSGDGGNDFWESGAVRPDLILEDLVRILHPACMDQSDSLHYYIKIQ